MIRLVSCITEEHNWRLLILAVCVCGAGNLAAAFMLSRARRCVRAHRNLWLAIAGCMIGGSIWATHFIAMLAYAVPSVITFQLAETALSIIVAIAISSLATFTSLYIPGRQGAIAAGLLLGLAIATMHAIGLIAIKASALLELNTGTTLCAWLAGGGFAMCATFLLSRRINGLRLVCASFFLVAAVCSHHLISMSGLTVVPLANESAGTLSSIDRIGIAAGVCTVSSLLIATGIAALFFDSHLTDVKGLANASFEGIVLTQAGSIVHANERFTTLVGRSLVELRSSPLDEFLIDRREEQGILQSPDGLRAVEVVERVIEYRGRETTVLGLRDVTERLAAHRQLDHLASHDPLTGLLNRRAFAVACEEAIAHAPAGEGSLALMTFDLDRFKAINDLFGHAEGDRVLEQVATLLKSCFASPAISGRIGGDEFAVLVPCTDLDEAKARASHFLDQFALSFAANEKAGALGSSVGVAMFPDHGILLRDLQNNADAALYRAKSDGRGRVCVFDRYLDQQIRERRRLEEELRHAVGQDQLFLLYQPIVDAASGSTKGYEALLRWRHPAYGILSPAVFIATAEESGIIVTIGRWVLEEACRQAATWENDFVAVNISPRQLLSPDLVKNVVEALERSGLDPARLELEVTETTLLEDRTEVAQSLRALKALGVKIVMDDYGSGYSSIGNLRRYPFDKIKIDRCYVAELDNDPVAEIVIDYALALGRSLGVSVVVEGIETEKQRQRIAIKAPDQLQGYLFGRPEVVDVHRSTTAIRRTI